MRYRHEFALSFTLESDRSCEDIDHFPSDQEFLEAILKRVTDLRQSGGNFQLAVDSPKSTIQLEE